MPKIRVEIEVPDSKYCDNEDTTCPMCLEGNWGKYYCCLFGSDLEIDEENQWYCIRCNKCKQAEIKDTTKSCKKCIHRYGKMCNLYDRELVMYGYGGGDYFGFIRCKECEQAEVEK